MSPAAPGAQRLLLRALADGGVDFVLIGGHAVAAHGHERATRDVDIVFSTDRESCERFSHVLAELNARVELADVPVPPEGISGGWLEGGGHFRFATDGGPLDALSSASGLTYERLAARAITVELSGSVIPICSLEDLVAMKRATGRRRDEEDLRAVREVRED